MRFRGGYSVTPDSSKIAVCAAVNERLQVVVHYLEGGLGRFEDLCLAHRMLEHLRVVWTAVQHVQRLFYSVFHHLLFQALLRGVDEHLLVHAKHFLAVVAKSKNIKRNFRYLIKLIN